MRLKRIAAPAFVGGFAIATSFVLMPLMASSTELEIEYTPLDAPAVEATNRWQWHPPMVLPVDLKVLPVSEQVDSVDTSYLQRPNGMPSVGPSGWED